MSNKPLFPENIKTFNHTSLEIRLTALYESAYQFNKQAHTKAKLQNANITSKLLQVKTSIEIQRLKHHNIQFKIEQAKLSPAAITKLQNKITVIQQKLINNYDLLNTILNTIVTPDDLLKTNQEYIEVCHDIQIIEDFISNINKSELLNLKYFN